MNKKFEEIAKEAYGWTIDYDGNLLGLTGGDMGYEKTDKTLISLVLEALKVGTTLSPKIAGGLDNQLYYLVRECMFVIKKRENK